MTDAPTPLPHRIPTTSYSLLTVRRAGIPTLRLRPAPCALRPAPCALRPAPCALKRSPQEAPLQAVPLNHRPTERRPQAALLRRCSQVILIRAQAISAISAILQRYKTPASSSAAASTRDNTVPTPVRSQRTPGGAHTAVDAGTEPYAYAACAEPRPTKPAEPSAAASAASSPPPPSPPPPSTSSRSAAVCPRPSPVARTPSREQAASRSCPVTPSWSPTTKGPSYGRSRHDGADGRERSSTPCAAMAINVASSCPATARVRPSGSRPRSLDSGSAR